MPTYQTSLRKTTCVDNLFLQITARLLTLIGAFGLAACQHSNRQPIDIDLSDEFRPAARVVRTDEARCGEHIYRISIASEHLRGIVEVDFGIDNHASELISVAIRERLSTLYSPDGVTITCTGRQARFLVSGMPRREYLEYINATAGDLPAISAISLIVEAGEIVSID